MFGVQNPEEVSHQTRRPHLNNVAALPYNFLKWNFLRILYTKSYWNWFSFYRVIQHIKRGTFF